MKAKKKGDKYMSTVKVGPKGQIVIPKEVRDMFGINSGDNLLILADSKRGIALERYGVFAKLAENILQGRPGTIDPHDEHTMEENMVFAQAVKEVGENIKKEREDEEDECNTDD